MNSFEQERKQPRSKTTINPKLPNYGQLHKLVLDLADIGYFGSDKNAISDQEIYYFATLRSIKYKPYELGLIKECAQTYVSAFHEYNDSLILAPYSPIETQEEQDARDEILEARLEVKK